MAKELVQIEFRYNKIPASDLISEHTTKLINVGIKANDPIETPVKTYNIRISMLIY